MPVNLMTTSSRPAHFLFDFVFIVIYIYIAAGGLNSSPTGFDRAIVIFDGLLNESRLALCESGELQVGSSWHYASD